MLIGNTLALISLSLFLHYLVLLLFFTPFFTPATFLLVLILTIFILISLVFRKGLHKCFCLGHYFSFLCPINFLDFYYPFRYLKIMRVAYVIVPNASYSRVIKIWSVHLYLRDLVAFLIDLLFLVTFSKYCSWEIPLKINISIKNRNK